MKALFAGTNPPDAMEALLTADRNENTVLPDANQEETHFCRTLPSSKSIP
jgi:hypothetical protein